MNGSLGTLLPSSVPSSLFSADTSPEDERRCALFSVGDEHAAVSRAASPAPIKVLLSTLVGSCPLPGLLWLAEAWSVIIERVSLSVLRDPMPGRWEGEPSSASQIRVGGLVTPVAALRSTNIRSRARIALDRADTPLHDRPSPSAEHQIKLTGLA